MMICKDCGLELKDGEMFCPDCGGMASAPVAPEKKSTVKDLGIASIVCAVMATVTHLFGGPVILMMIASAVTGILSNLQAKKQGVQRSGFATAGLVAAGAVLVMEVVATITEMLIIGGLVRVYAFYFLMMIIAMIGSTASV